jgi:hypothetical protein
LRRRKAATFVVNSIPSEPSALQPLIYTYAAQCQQICALIKHFRPVYNFSPGATL